MSFKDLNFKTFIQEALDEIKFKEPTPVQQKLIPVVRSGRDLVGESKTGLLHLFGLILLPHLILDD